MLNIRKLLVLLCCINSNILNAQNKDVTLRPVIGINMSSIKGDFIGIGNNSLNSNSSENMKWEVYDFYTNLHYMHLPILIKVDLFHSNFSAQMGIQVGWLFKATSHNGNRIFIKDDTKWIYDSESSGKAVTNVSFLYNKIDFGIPFRLSYEYKKGVFTLGYYMGLANIYKNSSNRIYNNSFSLSYGYNF